MTPRRLASALVLVGVTLTSSCGASSEDIEIDPTFTDFRRREIVRARDTWSGVADRRLFFVGQNDGAWLVIPALVEGGWRGNTNYHYQVIRIGPDTPDDGVYAVALHEFGHVLGLKHVSRGVMDPGRATVEFSDEDLAECRRVEACL